jgi:predicted metal-binding protein
MKKDPERNRLMQLEEIFRRHSFHDFRWIDPKTITVAGWVRMKCMFGCPEYGHNASCPPNVPGVDECAQFFHEYDSAVLFNIAKQLDSPKELKRWVKGVHKELLKVEREVFLCGFEKAFMFFIDNCCFCTECVPRREECKNPAMARPTIEAMAVDVYQTAHSAGFPIAVRTDPFQEMNRYALLMVE